MKRYYRALLISALLGLAVGIASLVLDRRILGVAGCLLIPATAYVLTLPIDLFRRISR